MQLEINEKLKSPPSLKNIEEKIVKIVIDSTTEANKKIIEKINQNEKKNLEQISSLKKQMEEFKKSNAKAGSEGRIIDSVSKLIDEERT